MGWLNRLQGTGYISMKHWFFSRFRNVGSFPSHVWGQADLSDSQTQRWRNGVILNALGEHSGEMLVSRDIMGGSADNLLGLKKLYFTRFCKFLGWLLIRTLLSERELVGIQDFSWSRAGDSGDRQERHQREPSWWCGCLRGEYEVNYSMV